MPIYEDLQSQIAQYEAMTGRKISTAALRALYEGELKARMASKAEAERIALEKRGMLLKEKQAKAEAGAAKMSGAIQLAGTGIQGYGMYRFFNPRTAPISTPSAGITPSLTSSLTTPVKLAPLGGETLTVPAATAPSLTGVPSLTPPASTVSLPSTTAPAAGGGMWGTAQGMLGPAGWGAAAGTVGGRILAGQDWWRGITPWGGRRTEQAMGGAISGATAGFVASGFNPIGALAGAITGALGGSTVICTELHRQGHIPLDVLLLDGLYRKAYIDNNTYDGYLLWAEPLARLMARPYIGRVLTAILKPLAVSWAYEMAHRLDGNIERGKIGWALNKVGVPVCRFIGKIKNMGSRRSLCHLS